MKDINGKIQYKGREYTLVFNLNVMETIQDEYGSIDKWGALTDGKDGEPNAKAVKFGFMQMLNEGIDIDNEENGENNPLLTLKQVGRIITEIGFENTTKKINEAVVKSTESNEKNA